MSLHPHKSPEAKSRDIDNQSETSAASRSKSTVTKRVLILAPFLILLNAWWITEIEYISYSDNCTTQALFFNAISLLLCLLGFNALVRRALPKWCSRIRRWRLSTSSP